MAVSIALLDETVGAALSSGAAKVLWDDFGSRGAHPDATARPGNGSLKCSVGNRQDVTILQQGAAGAGTHNGHFQKSHMLLTQSARGRKIDLVFIGGVNKVIFGAEAFDFSDFTAGDTQNVKCIFNESTIWESYSKEWTAKNSYLIWVKLEAMGDPIERMEVYIRRNDTDGQRFDEGVAISGLLLP